MIQELHGNLFAGLALQMQAPFGPFVFAGGALWSGQPRVGEKFQLVDMGLVNATSPLSPSDIREDRIKDGDAFGFKGKPQQDWMYIYAGQVTYFTFHGEDGFQVGLPPAPLPKSLPTTVPYVP